MEKPLNVYDEAYAALRAKGFLPNPWRLGKQLGSMGIEVPSPYSLPRSTRQFNQGLTDAFAAYQHIARILWRELRSGAWQVAGEK